MPRSPYRAELVGALSQMVLTITWAGRVYRWSDYPGEAVDREGNVVLFDGGLPPLRDRVELSLYTDTPQRRAIPIAVVFPDDVNAIEAQGHTLGSAVGELARWVVGSAWDDREVLIGRGSLAFAENGEAHEPVSFTLEESPYDDAALIPESTAVVDAGSYPLAHDSAIGAPYPLPFGAPGLYVDADGVLRACPGSPALIVSWQATADTASGTPVTPDTPGSVSALLIAAAQVHAPSVTVIDPEGTAEVIAVESTRDGYGRLVSTVDLSSATTVDRSLTGSWWVAWTHGGALLNRDESGAMDSAGEILRWLLERSTLRVDSGRLAVAEGLLRDFRVGFYLDESVSPWEAARKWLLKWLPVTMRYGPEGIYPLVMPWWLGAEGAVGTINADEPGVVRVGPVKRNTHPREVISEVRVEWAHDPSASNSPKRTTVLAANPAAGEYTSQHAAHAGREFGDRAGVVSLPACWDGPTAARVAQIEMRKRGSIPRVVTYELPDEEAWMREGAPVLVQDTSLSMTSESGLVLSSDIVTDESVTLSVLIYIDPSRSRITV